MIVLTTKKATKKGSKNIMFANLVVVTNSKAHKLNHVHNALMELSMNPKTKVLTPVTIGDIYRGYAQQNEKSLVEYVKANCEIVTEKASPSFAKKHSQENSNTISGIRFYKKTETFDETLKPAYETLNDLLNSEILADYTDFITKNYAHLLMNEALLTEALFGPIKTKDSNTAPADEETAQGVYKKLQELDDAGFDISIEMTNPDGINPGPPLTFAAAEAYMIATDLIEKYVTQFKVANGGDKFSAPAEFSKELQEIINEKNNNYNGPGIPTVIALLTPKMMFQLYETPLMKSYTANIKGRLDYSNFKFDTLTEVVKGIQPEK